MPMVPDKKSEIKIPNFAVWQSICEQILAKPFPPKRSDCSEEEILRDSRASFAALSNWEIVCEEILDTTHSHVYYQKCYNELRQRGKTEKEIFEMRRLAWQTAGWLNYAMMVWDWVNLNEDDIFRAIKWLHTENQITDQQRKEFEYFVMLHAGKTIP